MPEITKIETCKKNKNRVNIFVDDEFFMATFDEVCIKNKLARGTIIDESKLSEILKAEDKAKAENYAINLLSKFIKTENEVKKKMTLRGYSEDSINSTIGKLKDYGYLNDEAYAKNFKSFSEKIKGEKLIKIGLTQKGVAQNIIDNLVFSKSDQLEGATALANKWIRKKELTKENIFKMQNYLYGKGFSSEVIRNVAGTFFKNGELEQDESWDRFS